jgi:DNA-binding transcriptional LysR family regulator
MQIRSLEKRIGSELFHRTGRTVSLTEAGHALIPMARDLTSRAVSVEEAMASLEGEVFGVLRIACTTTAGKYVLPRMLARFQVIHPRVQTVCAVVGRGLASEMLVDGEAQIGIASMTTEHHDLEYRPFMTDRIVLITHPDHPWAQRDEPIDPTELEHEKYIVREDTAGTTAAVRQGLAWHDINADGLEVTMTLGNSEAIRMAVQEGIGVAFVSALVAEESAEIGRLAIVPVEGLELTKTLYLIRHPQAAATRAGAAFWDFAFSSENEEIRLRPSLIGVEA